MEKTCPQASKTCCLMCLALRQKEMAESGSKGWVVAQATGVKRELVVTWVARNINKSGNLFEGSALSGRTEMAA